MSQKIYLNILKGGVFAAFLVLFFVFDSLLFPYISSKQISFDILIEVLSVFWITFLVKYPAWRPQRSWITVGLVGFMAALLITAFTGVDFNMSFWGNVERMLGVFELLHFLVFYLIIITVFRTRSDWQNLLAVSVAAATLQSFWVMLKINYGTFGNTSYVSGYMIFNIFFALILFFRQKNWGWRSLYIISILLMLNSMKIASTRGAFVGLGLSILLGLFMLAMFNKNKKIKYGSLIGAGLFVVLIAAIFSNADSGWVKSNPVFARITQINAQTNTFQTRLISWRAAFQDFKNHPILGTGYGNYAITFDKFFDPAFYNYSASETYFDHAHNNVIDILSTSGLLGLLAYLSIFVAILYYLIKGFRNGKIELMEFVLLVCLLVAYFIQNIVLFDSFVTYFSLMITLGFIYWLSRGEGAYDNIVSTIKNLFTQAKGEAFTNKEFYSLLVAGVIMFTIFYQYNYRPLMMLKGTIKAQYIAGVQEDIIGAVNAYRTALSYDTPLDRQARSTLVQLVLQRSELFARTDKAQAQAALDYTIEQVEKNVKLNPKDSFTQMLLAQLLNFTASYNSDNQQKFSEYSNRAEQAINASIEATPRRIPVYFIKAQIYLSRGENKKAFDILRYAISLNHEYADAQCQLVKFYFYAGEKDSAYKETDRCIDLGGAGNFSSSQLSDFISYYLKKKDTNRLIKLFQALTSQQPKEGKVWASLAELYRQAGRKAEAIAAAEKAAEVDPSLEASAEKFIQDINK